MDRREVLKSLALAGLGARVAWADDANLVDRGPEVKGLESLGYVVITPEGPDDGGHFGPKTANTRTAGFQEALDYSDHVKKDLYVVGQFAYITHETIRMPWRQDWRMDGGEYVLWYNGLGDAVVIDSQMSCRIKLGLVGCPGGGGAAIRVSPQNIGPDGFRVFTCSDLIVNAVVGGGDVFGNPETKQTGTGILIEGPVVANRFDLIEVNACDIGIDMKAGPSHNWIESPFVHLCNNHIKVGDEGAPNSGSNLYRATIMGGAPGSTGVQVFGHRNHFTLDVSQQAPGRDVVFESTAYENVVVATQLTDGITNSANTPTNRVVLPKAQGFAIVTPEVPQSRDDLTNREPYTVEVFILDPGAVTEWTLTDAAGTAQAIRAPLSAGQSFVLESGERIRLTYTSAPKWRWKALR